MFFWVFLLCCDFFRWGPEHKAGVNDDFRAEISSLWSQLCNQTSDATVCIVCHPALCVSVAFTRFDKPNIFQDSQGLLVQPTGILWNKAFLLSAWTELDLMCVQTGVCQWELVPLKNSSETASPTPSLASPFPGQPGSLPCWKLGPITVFVGLITVRGKVSTHAS